MKKLLGLVLLTSTIAHCSSVGTQAQVKGEEGVVVEGPNGNITVLGIPNQQRFSPNVYPGGIEFDFGDPGTPGYARDLSATSSFFSMVKDSSNRLVVCGFGNRSGTHSWIVARYTSAGVLDSTFNSMGSTPGYVQEDGIGTIGVSATFDLGSSEARGLAIDPDGNILVCGSSLVSTTTVWTVVSYTPNGTDHAIGTAFAGSVVGKIQETELGYGTAYSISLSTTSPYIIYTGGFTTPSSPTVITTISYLTTGARNPAYNP